MLFFSSGAKVVIGCRDARKGQETLDFIASRVNSASVFCFELDLSSFKSVRTFVSSFYSECKRESRPCAAGKNSLSFMTQHLQKAGI